MRAFAPLPVVLLAISATMAPLGAQVQGAGAPSSSTPDAAAITSSLKSQLRNLVSAQEAFYADKSTYSNSLKELGYMAREGAYVMVFRADKKGWAGRAVHPSLPGKSCVIWVGAAETNAPKTDAMQVTGREGEPVCDTP